MDKGSTTICFIPAHWATIIEIADFYIRHAHHLRVRRQQYRTTSHIRTAENVQVYISSQGTTCTLIKSIAVTIVLVSGVTVKATPDADNPSVLVTDAGVVGATGVAATGGNAKVTGMYTAATATAPGKVMVHVARTEGFTTGKFVGVLCDVAVGSFPKATDFSLIDFKAVDPNGVAITGLTGGFTANI